MGETERILPRDQQPNDRRHAAADTQPMQLLVSFPAVACQEDKEREEADNEYGSVGEEEGS